MNASGKLVAIEDLTRHFPMGRGQVVHAVDGVTLDIGLGETLGLVGESGCGKSTLGRLFCGLDEATRGRVVFDGVDITALHGRERRSFRPRMQMIFQDPFSSLNPHKTVEQIIAFPLRVKGFRTKPKVRARVEELLRLVELDPAQARGFPHQFSGGQRQRIGIARALACEPELIIADEPVASLDVSIQAQILSVFRGLQQRLALTALFISHDISVVSHVSQRIAVMYLGRIVEVGPAEAVVKNALHPYTRALLAAVPRIDREARSARTRLSGDVPSPMAIPAGCRFHTRCYMDQIPRCRQAEPELREVRRSHMGACHLADGSAQAHR